MSSLLSNIGDLITLLGKGIVSFVDFIINLPTLFYNLIILIPEPLYSVLISFISLILFVIVLKVVAHFV